MSLGVTSEAMWASAVCVCRQVGLPACPAMEGRVVLRALFPPLHWAPSWHRVHKESPGLSFLSLERGEQRGTYSLPSAT